MVLIRTQMPVNAHYFLKTWNDWVRWYWRDATENFSAEFHQFKMYDMDFGKYHPLLKMADYEHLIAENMLMILMVLAICLALWAVLTLIDLCRWCVSSENRREWRY